MFGGCDNLKDEMVEIVEWAMNTADEKGITHLHLKKCLTYLSTLKDPLPFLPAFT